MKLIWLDLETSGLRPEFDLVLEVAAAVADFDDPFDATPLVDTVIATPADAARLLADSFVRKMHTDNNLFAECQAAHEAWTMRRVVERIGSPNAQSSVLVSDVEEELLRHVPEAAKDERWVLAGSTVGFDKAFLAVHMPKLHTRLSHRIYDVSSIKLFCQSLGMPKPPKAEAHRAMADVRESIAHARQCAHWLENREFRRAVRAPF